MPAQQNIVGPQVRKIRYQRGLTQQAMAARCEVLGMECSRAMISKIESQLRCVTDYELTILAQALKAPLLDLFPPRLRPSLER